MVVSVLVGLVFLCTLSGLDHVWICFMSLPILMVFHLLIVPGSWRGFLGIVLRLIGSIPRAVLEGLYVVFWREGEYFEIVDIDEDREIASILSTTLTPRSVVFLSEGDRLHVHRLGEMKR